MKIKHLLIAALAMAAMAACQKEGPVNGSGSEGVLAEMSYLSINVSNVPQTRAPGDASYEEGIEAENAVNHIRFYFFKEDGTPANVVAKGTDTKNYVNYFDYEPTTVNDDNPEHENLEKIVSATVVINTAQGDLLPAQMAAVVNAETTETSLSLSQLRKLVKDYSSTTDGFVMSSSVYKDGTTRMDAVQLKTVHFQLSESLALQNPVEIYVERVLAKVRVGIEMNEGVEVVDLGNGRKIYYTGKTSDKSLVENDNNKVYVEFLGWDVTTTVSKSYLVKNINSAWADNLFTAWNYDPYYRSYWAVNPTLAESDYQYFTFNEVRDHNFTANDASNYTYCQENASNNYTTGVSPDLKKRTQVIIAAQLVNKTGEQVELVEWQGFRYTQEALKSVILSYLQDSGYTVTLQTTDLVYKTPVDLGDPYGYEVYAQLKDSETTGVTKGDKTYTNTEINDLLKDLPEIKIWKNGYTYYYVDIAHLNPQPNNESTVPGAFGVVRNHIYDIDITSVAGLGTPVYDPDETPDPDDKEEIIPEKPTYDESYLAARVNVLSWKVVNQDVDLN